MRIIRGKFKNKALFFPQNTKTRPLKDNVRESIFNILEHSKKININIKNSKILDLYSGSGSFGLESFSRYETEVHFVEKDMDALNSLKKNIKNLDIEDKVFLHETDVINFIENLNNDKKFEIIFFDPPYSDNSFLIALEKIKEKNLINNNYVIIIHRDKKERKILNNKNINILENRTYGRSQIFFVKFI